MSVEEIVNKSKQGLKEMDKNKKKISFDEGFSAGELDVIDNKDVGKTVTQDTVQPNSNNDHILIKNNYKVENQLNKTAAVKYPCKMTFYMTEEIYDAFNHIYAKRLLAKKKVDKGALFCEIVQSFIENNKE